MPTSIKTLKIEAKKALTTAQDAKTLEAAFRSYLGREGELTRVFQSLAKLRKAKRVKLGKEANELRIFLTAMYQERLAQLGKAETQGKNEQWIDVTAPGKKIETGHLHPLTLVQRKAVEIFQSMGFAVAQGPEIETEWYNFDALNIPKDHPARDMWDTFWLKQETPNSNIQHPKQRLLLRTHTSPVQIRYMESHKPPLRIIAPGRIFRYEATDARHEINFYQLEGLMIGENVTAANFKAIIAEFYTKFFGKSVNVRLRPSYFPFTEPSFEVDMSCVICGGKGLTLSEQSHSVLSSWSKDESKGCSSCGGGGWIEIMGAGMVHPNVLKAVKIDPTAYQGFAFGMGVDRLAMMKYKINDVRLFYSGDLRFLQQF